MRVIVNNKEVFIDERDLNYFNSKKWFVAKIGNNNYLVCDERYNGGKYIYFHRHIMNYPNIKEVVDHIDMNGLNNQRNNLRVINKSKNAVNARIRNDNTLGFKGVCIHRYKQSVYYVARLFYNNTQHTKSRKCLLAAAYEYNKLKKIYLCEQ